MSDIHEGPIDIYREARFFGLREVLKAISKQLLSDFQSSSVIVHGGDMGEERERLLQLFLSSGHFPKKYALSKGHGKVISAKGHASLQTDIVLYDSLQCPILRDGETHQFFPIESVYGVIQVKSRLSKTGLLDAAENIASVKKLAEYKKISRQYASGLLSSVGEVNPLPFGAIFAYSLDGNSLQSLADNIADLHAKRDPMEWINLVCVLNEGVIFNTFDFDRVLDSRDLIRLKLQGTTLYSPTAVEHKENALLDFYLSLIGALGMLQLLPPPLHEYVDLPITTTAGHYYRGPKMLRALECPKHGFYEPRINDEWINSLVNFLNASPPQYKPSVYLALELGQSPPIKEVGDRSTEEYMPTAHIFSRDGIDPLPLIKMRFVDDKPIRSCMDLEIDGRQILVPLHFIDKEHPLFEACPRCPRGNASVM